MRCIAEYLSGIEIMSAELSASDVSDRRGRTGRDLVGAVRDIAHPGRQVSASVCHLI
jgi:hypothetical protein